MLKLFALAALLAATAAAPSDYPLIKDLQKTDSTPSSVTLSWTLDVSQFVPTLYTLVIDSVLTVQFFNDGTTTYTATGLQSCKEYTFDLTANYDGEPGEAAHSFGSTDYETPGAVGGLTVDGSVITWTAPSNARCVEYYTVCYHSTVTDDSDCTEGVIFTTYDLGSLSACDELDVTVSAVGGDITGEPSSVHVTTPDGVPGMVRDVEVVPLTETSVLLAWNPPLENPACVQEYAIVFGPVNNFTVTDVSFGYEVSKTENKEDEDDNGEDREVGPSGQKETATLTNLVSCTDYRFGVSAVSKGDEYSDEVVVYLSTNDSAPGVIPDVVFNPGEDSITISWGDVSDEVCLHVIQICYIEPVNHTFQCFEVPPTPNTWTLTGLGACREYELIIAGVSSGGSSGEPIVITVPTTDRAPGAVQNLALGNVQMTSLTVTYDEPTDYPECADEYIVSYKNLLDVVDARSATPRAGSFTTNLDGLDACALYDIGVNAVSPTGIEGPVETIRTPMAQGMPDPPSDGQLLTNTSTSLTVLWFAPVDTRFCVDTYEVRVSESGSGPTEFVEVLDFNQQLVHTFGGLSPCTSYMVQIRSINSETTTSSAYATVLTDARTVCP